MLDSLGGAPWIARSSGITEDSAAQSFAGQYTSVLGITTTEAAIAAIDRVRASAQAPHVIQYSNQKVPATLGVLLQRMVSAERGGVCFTHDPVSAEPVAIIESAWGLGTTVVEGRIVPDSYIVNRDGKVTHRPSTQSREDRYDPDSQKVVERALRSELKGRASLSTFHARQVATLAVELLELFGIPLDIEWCFDSAEKLWLVQVRPVTALFSPHIAEHRGGRQHE